MTTEEEIKAIREGIEALQERLAKLKKPELVREIDWSKVPDGTLCECSNHFGEVNAIKHLHYGDGHTTKELWAEYHLHPLGWQPHFGGECPVNREVWVVVKSRANTTNEGLAKQFQWSHWNGSDDIVAYKVIEPCPDWVREMGAGE